MTNSFRHNGDCYNIKLDIRDNLYIWVRYPLENIEYETYIAADKIGMSIESLHEILFHLIFTNPILETPTTIYHLSSIDRKRESFKFLISIDSSSGQEFKPITLDRKCQLKVFDDITLLLKKSTIEIDYRDTKIELNQEILWNKFEKHPTLETFSLENYYDMLCLVVKFRMNGSYFGGVSFKLGYKEINSDDPTFVIYCNGIIRAEFSPMDSILEVEDNEILPPAKNDLDERVKYLEEKVAMLEKNYLALLNSVK